MIRTACMAIGVITGCLLGMSTIMLVDVEKRDREEKIKQLEPLMRSIVDSCVRYLTPTVLSLSTTFFFV